MKGGEANTARWLYLVRWSQQFRPAADPLPGSAGRPTFNQLKMVLYLQTQFGEDRCTQFRVIVVTDPQTNTQTDGDDYNTLQHSFTSAQCNNSVDISGFLWINIIMHKESAKIMYQHKQIYVIGQNHFQLHNISHASNITFTDFFLHNNIYPI